MTDKQQPDPLALADEAWNFDCSEYRGARHANAAMMGKMQDCADMIRKLHAELERLALYKSLADEYGLSIFPDIAEMTAELETLRAKLKTYEDLGGAADDVHLLRMGYAAARLEIESLQSQLHAAKQINAAQFGPLPAPTDPMDWPLPCDLTAGSVTICKGCTLRTVQVRLQVQSETNALLMRQLSQQPAPQQEAQEPYSIDADPQGIRATVADAITGVLAFGAQGTNAPPDGHWLAPFWAAARAEREPAPQPSPASQGDALSQAARDVLAERQRQISAEGWTPEHDDEHVNDEIASMACYYVMPPGAREWSGPDGYGDTLGDAIRPDGWDAKDCDRRRELVKGTALALAELERIDRADAARAAQEGK